MIHRLMILFFSLAAWGQGGEVQEAGEQQEPAIWPEFDKAYAAVFNEEEGQFDPLIDDGRRVAKVDDTKRKELTREKLAELKPFVTGKHRPTLEIDFYRPTAGIWFERDGKVVAFLEFSFESFSRRTDLEKVSREVAWKEVDRWFASLGLKTNFNEKLLERMWATKE